MGIIQLSPSDVDRFWAKVQVGSLNECWEWQGAKDQNGYGHLRVNGKTERTHRLSYLIHTGDQPGDRLIRHHCDNPPCCNPHHLEPGTYKDNAMDMMERGRQGTGHIKLQPEEVIDIFTRYWCNWAKSGDLAKEYGVTVQHIPYITRGDVWQEILDPLAHIREASDRFKGWYTPKVIRDICFRYCRDGLSTTEIAEIYDIAPTTVGNIFNGHNWGDLTADIRAKYPVDRNRWKILDAASVRDIYVRHVVDGEQQKALAVEYGICRVAISNIKTGKIWAKETADLRALHGKGSDKSRKLTAELAREIYVATAIDKEDCATVARRYESHGVSRETVYKIRAGKKWASATADLRSAS